MKYTTAMRAHSFFKSPSLNNSFLKIPFIMFLLLGLNACSQYSIKDNANKLPTQSKHGNQHDEQIGVLDLSAIQSMQSLSKQLGGYRVVFVGESHTDYGHHLNQLAVIKKSHQKWGGDLSIGLEMIQQPFQAGLDEYIAGRINERQMLKKVEWYKRWKYDFRLYKPIFDYAKQHKIPLIALNIPREVTKRVSTAGINGLTPADRRLLPKIIDRSNKQYEARLKSVFSMHAHGGKDNSKAFENFYDAQLAWDEGMAFAAANYLKKHRNGKMVVIAGSGHIINRDGIPSRLERLMGQKSLVILNSSNIDTIGEQPSPKHADYLLYSPNAKLPASGLIGITMTDAKNGIQGGQGVKVGSVIAKGAAAKAGIQANDVIIAIDQQAIKETSDVSLWRLYKKPGDKATVKLLRNNKTLTKTLFLGKPQATDMLDFSRIHK